MLHRERAARAFGVRVPRVTGDAQVILGVAAPITWGGGATDAGVFVYFSYELPFRR
jgi:hypothetical protein